MTNREKPSIKKRVAQLGMGLAVFVLLSAVYTAVFLQFSAAAKTKALAANKENSAKQLDYLAEIIHSRFDSVISDLVFLSTCDEVRGWATSGRGVPTRAIERTFAAFAAARGTYDQIRLLDAGGKELVRINMADGAARIIPADALQDKGSRYYFQETKRLSEGQIYLSPLDLNIEHEVIEYPIKPMLRLGTPLYDGTGKFKGEVILNFLGDIVLDDIASTEKHSIGDICLINQEGYWLYSKTPGLSWAFMYPDKAERTMQHLFPERWTEISGHERTQEVLDETLVSSAIVAPLSETHINASTRRWILVNTIPLSELNIAGNQIYRRYLEVSLFVLPLFLVASLAVSVLLGQRQRYKSELRRAALYDGLTALPNRNLLLERIESTLKLARRHSFLSGLLFMDLDGFKAVNDTFGHEAGDELLRQVASRLLNCVRSSDTVARYGGDEFVILLPKIDEKKNCALVSEKILAALSEPFRLRAAEVTVGGSIGAIVVDQGTSDSIDDLITKADAAMYAAKKGGKNTYVMA